MLAAFGIILIVAGAIVTFAVDASVSGVDLQALGYILMGGGALALLAAAIQAAGWASMRNSKLHRPCADARLHKSAKTTRRSSRT